MRPKCKCVMELGTDIHVRILFQMYLYLNGPPQGSFDFGSLERREYRFSHEEMNPDTQSLSGGF